MHREISVGSARIDSTSPASEITGLLVAWQQGGVQARERLIGLVYDDLRRIAGAQLGGNPASLQPTALVHEAYIKLLGGQAVPWQGRAHFMAVAAVAMRQIAIDHARRQGARKRDGGVRVTLREGLHEQDGPDVDVLDLHDALERLAALHPDKARIVELHYFGGLSSDEIAEVVGVSAITVKRGWRAARAWLHQQLVTQ